MKKFEEMISEMAGEYVTSQQQYELEEIMLLEINQEFENAEREMEDNN